MKRSVFLVAALSMLVAVGCAKPSAPPAPPAPASGHDTPVPPPPVGSGHDTPVSPPPVDTPKDGPGAALGAVAFPSAQTGWAGGQGLILVTADGGKTWTTSYTGRANITGLKFADAQHGWATATDGLLRTADGGKTWTVAAIPGKPLTDAAFDSPTHGWGTDGQILYETSDAGSKWTERKTPSPVDAVCAPSDGGSVWASGSTQALRSTDGGKTWAVAFSAPVEGTGWRTRLACGPDYVWVMVYSNGMANQQPYVVFRSADGGRSWVPLLSAGYFSPRYPTVKTNSAIDAYAGPFSVQSVMAASFLGECPACQDDKRFSLTSTTDGGKTWSHHSIPLGSLGGIAFVTPTEGRVVGADKENHPVIQSTTDGGATWKKVYPAQ